MMAENKDIGKALQVDLTVNDPSALKKFYKSADGWQAKDHPMGDMVNHYKQQTPQFTEGFAGGRRQN